MRPATQRVYFVKLSISLLVNFAMAPSTNAFLHANARPLNVIAAFKETCFVRGKEKPNNAIVLQQARFE